MEDGKKPLQAPTITTYDRDELAAEPVFTGEPQS